MQHKTLLLIDPSLNTPEVQGARNISQNWQGETLLLLPSLRSNSDRINAITHADVDALIIMGSASSVHDNLPWQQELALWLEPIILGPLDTFPCLGICFGHQFLAHITGGLVGYHTHDHHKRRGVETSHMHNSLLMQNDDMSVVVSHREHVVTLPHMFRPVATRQGVPIDAFEHTTRPIFGVQFHPEAGVEFAHTSGFDPETITKATHEDGQRLIRAFMKLAYTM